MGLLNKTSNKKNTIIWAVDSTQNPKNAKKIIMELKIWAKRLNCDVLPVSVFPQSTLNFPVDLTTLWKKGIEKFAYEAVNQYLNKTRVKGFLPPEVVFAESFSSRKMATELSKYAEKMDASLIVANTHVKKTWSPIRLGGFAETLVVTSRVPVLLLNQSAIPSKQIPSVLFPTDFSKESNRALKIFAPWVKSFKSKVFIYNQVERPNDYAPFYGAYYPTIDWATLTKNTEKSRIKNAKILSRELQENGIDSEAIIQRQKKSIASDIIEIANQKRVDLIALASQCGPLSQALLGSKVRDLLLQAKCPVLIFHHPKADRKHATKIKKASMKNSIRPKGTGNGAKVLHA